MSRGNSERRIDLLRHCHEEWRWRSAGVWAAYERWTAASEPERTLEFAAYRVALDLEERACSHYMDLAARMSHSSIAAGSGSTLAA
jgi:hypothetical protein